MKPYTRTFRHYTHEKTKYCDLRSSSNEVTIPKKIAHYIVSPKMNILVWINKKNRMEIAKPPIKINQLNGAIIRRRLYTNGNSYSLTIPAPVYDALVVFNDFGEFYRLKILVNSNNNIEIYPAEKLNLDKRCIKNKKPG